MKIRFFAAALAAMVLMTTVSVEAKTPLDTLRARYDKEGNPEGRYLYPKADGANLRILDMNIWQYDGAKSPDAWAALGEDCTNETRSKGYAELVQAYLPEVICLQEYSMPMHDHMYPAFRDAGYEMTFIPDSINYTPIYYKKNKMKLLDTGYFSYAKPFNNHGTKSYTTAVFRLKKNGEKFAVINTHLWWKSEKVMAGSDHARAEQVKLVIAEAERLREEHGCPVFIMGDLNANLRTEALGVALAAGYKPVWEVATEYGDLRCGHHECDAKGFSRKQNKTDDGYGCIDHFMVWENDLIPAGGNVEVKVFMRDYAWFTLLLTDHYPNYADIVLKKSK